MRCNYLHFELERQGSKEYKNTNIHTNAKKSECATFSISHTHTHVCPQRERMNECAMQMCVLILSLLFFSLINSFAIEASFWLLFSSLFEILQLHGTMWSAPYFISGCMPRNQFQLHNNNSLNGWSWCVHVLFVRYLLHFMFHVFVIQVKNQ